jgi:hypothetical protein
MSWIEELGRDTDYAHVEGCDIVLGWEDPKVLRKFDTPEQAQETFDAWLREVIKEQDAKIQNHAPPGTWASVAQMMAQSSPVDGDPDFWDRWKDEMKERDLFEDR